MSGDVPGGPVVNNLPCNDAENEGSVPGWGTEISHAVGKLSLQSGACAPQLEKPIHLQEAK